MGPIYDGILIPILIIEKFQIFQYSHVYVVTIIPFLVYIIGLGLFRANAKRLPHQN